MPAGFADVSVITPAYNAGNTIARTLASIAAQTLRPSEVIVVDDGSTDGTAAIAESFAPGMTGIRLKIIRQETRGAAAARNTAIKAAGGKWLAFLDADDEWLPAKIERCMTELSRRDGNIASHDYIRVENGRERIIDCARHCGPGVDPFVAQFLYGFISSTTIVVHRDLILRSGGFDPGLRSGHDYELWLALLSMPETRFCMIPEPLSRYHITPGGITSNVDLRRASALTALVRHWRSLKGRSRLSTLVAVLRAGIIHAQAAGMHLGEKKYGAAFNAIFSAPLSIARSLANPPPGPRPDFLNDLHQTRS